MEEYSVSYDRITLVVLLIIIIIIYLLLYNKWEQMTTLGAWTRAISGLNRDGFTGSRTNTGNLWPVSSTTNNTRGHPPVGYQGIEDGSYTTDTLSEQMLGYINPILAQILNQINTKTNKRYYLRKIDRVNINPIDKGFIGCEKSNAPGTMLKSACPAIDAATQEIQLGVRYTVDFFAHELDNQETFRFIVIFTANSQGEIQVEHFNISNGQIRPDKMFPSISELNIDTLAKPNNLIITDTALLHNTHNNNNSIMGIPTSTIEFSIFKPDGNNISHGWTNSAQLGNTFLPGIFQSDNKSNSANVNTILESQPPFNTNWPQRKHGKWWDAFGVANVENNNNHTKLGLDHAIDIRPPQIYDNPTVVKSESNAYDNDNHWLFNRARGILHPTT